MKELLTNHFNLPYLDLVKVEAGTFMMGSNPGDPGAYEAEYKKHPVLVQQDFWMMAYPVSQAFWEAVMGENPSEFKDPNRPVEQVRWDNIRQEGGFLDRLNDKFSGLNSSKGGHFRLPSEAQWEYAARGGPFWKEDFTYSGSDFLETQGYFEENTGEEMSEPIGLKAPNALGLFDMSGNVWEWCEDNWHVNYKDAPNTEIPWVDSPNRGDDRVNRGGSWSSNRQDARVANRYVDYPDNTWSDLGFRLVFV